MRCKVTAAVAALPIVLGVAEARADEGAFRFVYDTSVEGCPGEARVQALVIARLGFDPFVAPRAEAAVLRIAIARDEEQGLVARVGREPGGVRVLRDRAGDCNELAASAVLAASIAIDPTGSLAQQHQSRTEPAPPASSSADDPWQPEREREPPSPPPPKSTLGAFVGARTLGSVGFAPGPSIGFSVEGGLRLGRVELRLEGRADLPVSADPLPDGANANASLLLGSAVPCYVAGVVRFCGVVAAGSFLVESENITPSTRNQAFFAAVGLRPSIEVPLSGPLRLTGSVEGLVPLRRLTLSVRNTEVWTAPPVTVSLGAGLLVHFL